MSLNLFLRAPSVVNNITLETMRKRQGLSFRKTLGVYNFKVKPKSYYKNPHEIELRKKEQLLKGGDKGMRKIHALQRLSVTPFGSFNTKGRFTKDKKRIPNYNIPDLTDFPLKPYMSYKTDKMIEEHIQPQETMNRDFLLKNIKTQLNTSKDPEVRKLVYEIFETQQGRQIVKEYLDRQNKMRKLKITNF